MLGEEHWYAIYCKSRHEHKVHSRLMAKGIASYLADYEIRVKWGERLRKFRKNLLPGYVLVRARMDSPLYLAVLQTESVVKFVGRPWPQLSWIPDQQVQSLHLLLESRHQFEEVPYFDAGDEVEVITGPLAGLRGAVNGPANQKHRVIVSIDLLRRSVALEIDSYLLRRAPETPAYAEV
jgi:transcription termination/antitermination protein NusG